MPATFVYVRHAHDEKNSHHRLDEKLSDQGKKKARRVARKLIEQYGVPEVIYHSPMYRTRQTAKEFLKAINHYHRHHHGVDKAPPTRLAADPRLGRLFTAKEQRHRRKALRKSTENVIMDHNKMAFRARVADQFQALSTTGGGVIWNVTHSLVLLHVARINNIHRDKRVKYLDTLVIEK